MFNEALSTYNKYLLDVANIEYIKNQKNKKLRTNNLSLMDNYICPAINLNTKLNIDTFIFHESKIAIDNIDIILFCDFFGLYNGNISVNIGNNLDYSFYEKHTLKSNDCKPLDHQFIAQLNTSYLSMMDKYAKWHKIINLNTLNIYPECIVDRQPYQNIIMNKMRTKYDNYIKEKQKFPIDIGVVVFEYGQDYIADRGFFIFTPSQNQFYVNRYLHQMMRAVYHNSNLGSIRKVILAKYNNVFTLYLQTASIDNINHLESLIKHDFSYGKYFGILSHCDIKYTNHDGSFTKNFTTLSVNEYNKGMICKFSEE